MAHGILSKTWIYLIFSIPNLYLFINSQENNEYSLNAELIWENEVKDKEIITQYTKSFEDQKDDIFRLVPEGFIAEINSSNIEIDCKNNIFLI